MKPCLDCGALTDKSRCETHRLARQRARDRRRGSPAERGLDSEYRKQRDRLVAAWVTAHGWVCPGWRRQAHPVAPGGLTGDHTIPRAAGGTQVDAVLCGPCNSSKGAQQP